MKKMKTYFVTRNDEADLDEYDSAVVVAESPKAAVELIKAKHGKVWSHWGNFDVSVTEIVPDKPKIILESFNAG